MSGLGAASADTLFATIALFSLTFVLSFIESYMAVIKVLGGILVIIVGMTILLKNPVGQIRKNRAGKGNNLWSDYLSVLFVTPGQSGLHIGLRRTVRRLGHKP